ncbi:MAG: hypothetical protein D6769_00515 [Methanobacteriota archaeon]|nr:MAG: hypothetical protein D6769_00515 [Euryarchaeota archaeon]
MNVQKRKATQKESKISDKDIDDAVATIDKEGQLDVPRELKNLVRKIGVRELNVVIAAILKRCDGNARYESYNVLQHIILTKYFSVDVVPTLLAIINRTSGSSTYESLRAFSNLLEYNHLHNVRNKINEIIYNTGYYGMKNALEALNVLLNNGHNSPMWMEKVWEPLFSYVVEEYGDDFDSQFLIFGSLASIFNKEYISPAIVPYLLYIMKKSKKRETANNIARLNEAIKKRKLGRAEVALLGIILENSEKKELEKALETLSVLLHRPNYVTAVFLKELNRITKLIERCEEGEVESLFKDV